MHRSFRVLFAVATVSVAVLHSANLRAQGTTGPVIRDSNVGYIDPAIPADLFRFRYDAAYDNIRPTRAEFFWSPGEPFGRGPDIPERRVDYQDLLFYYEHAFNPQLSAFVELPVRFLNPELNPNAAGLADMNVGIKYAFVFEEDRVVTFQFRTYAPTGDTQRGLGNSHATLEPGLLLYQSLGAGWNLEAQLRDWIPVGGGDFAGNIIVYGVGLHYDRLCCGSWQVAPVAEFVGWTALGGKVSIVEPNSPPVIESAAGDTILNVKLGLRIKPSECGDLYIGYGRPLTGDSWYSNTFRIELRVFL